MRRILIRYSQFANGTSHVDGISWKSYILRQTFIKNKHHHGKSIWLVFLTRTLAAFSYVYSTDMYTSMMKSMSFSKFLENDLQKNCETPNGFQINAIRNKEWMW